MRSTFGLLVISALASLTLLARVPVQARRADAPVETPVCGLSLPGVRPLSPVSVLDQKYRAKFGRYSPAGEAQAKTAQEKLAGHMATRRAQQQCPISAAGAPSAGTAAVQIAKYGRSFPVRRQSAAVVASAHTEPCEHACCQQAE